MGAPLFDFHCHLDWFASPTQAAADADAQSLSIFANTVTPAGSLRAQGLLAGCQNMRVGIGAHPWWVADGRLDNEAVARATELASGHSFVGEVGLDFSPAHTPRDSHDRQVAALRRILAACDAGAQECGPKLISLHAVRSAGIVVDLLEETGCLRSCRCIFHWFSGTSDELHRAVQAGCSFSVNEMMLATRRGREYARQLPQDRLLTETDLPPGEGSSIGATEIVASLNRTLQALATIRGTDVSGLVADNASRLLSSVS